jgi:hypothetical protein
MSKGNKDIAAEIYAKHLAIASVDGRLFRKTTMDEMMSTLGISLASAATLYNNAKKASPVAGLGRPAIAEGVRKPGTGKAKGVDELQDDNQCFAVIELVGPAGDVVGRCRTYLMQGDASEEFDEVTDWKPAREWVMIQGLGPCAGDTFRLDAGEKEIKRYTPEPMKKAAAAVS